MVVCNLKPIPMDEYTPDILHIQRNMQHFDLNKCKILADWLAARIHMMEIDKKQYKTSIHELQLSARTTNVLFANNIITVGELLMKAVNWDEIRVLKGAGDKVLAELREKVTELRKNQ
jgi:DNA-directed RNA polymerase alpha subunit